MQEVEKIIQTKNKADIPFFDPREIPEHFRAFTDE